MNDKPVEVRIINVSSFQGIVLAVALSALPWAVIYAGSRIAEAIDRNTEAVYAASGPLP